MKTAESVKKASNETNDTNRATLWLRLGVSLDCSMQEATSLLNGNADVLQKIIGDGRFKLDRKSYIPGWEVETFNSNYGTSFEESDVELDM